jgi:hypothetical protein
MPLKLIVSGLITSIFALGIGFSGAYLVYQPELDSLEATIHESASSYSRTSSRLTMQNSLVANLQVQLRSLRVEEERLSQALKEQAQALSEIRPKLTRSEGSSRAAQLNLLLKDQELRDAEANIAKLELTSASYLSERDDLVAAFAVQKEITRIFDESVKPVLGDGALLAQRGINSSDNQNYGNSAAFFETASDVFLEAENSVNKLALKNEQLVSLIPTEMRKTFVLTQRRAKANTFVVKARSAEYAAAAKLYRVLDKWQLLEETDVPSGEQAIRWKRWVTEAELQIEQAMSYLDEAADWAPALWQEFEAQRIEIRIWRNLADGIRGAILEELEPIGIKAGVFTG